MESEEKLIKKYCGDIKSRIHACHDINIAHVLAQRLCEELNIYCQSQVVQNVLKRHVEKIIAETFDENGINKNWEL
ncbi:hypothetical protein JW935_18805 [candidate division KSB1 bacterium]|nr:hypothetical protein [candidate division KSB1 bacterium]